MHFWSIKREWTSLLIKQTLLPIKCRNSKLFPTMEEPEITSHPECGSQCNGRASASGHNPGNWNIFYHKDKPGQCEKRSLFSELITCSVTGILITQSQAIQRPRGERFQCGPKDFPELQTGGPRSLVQMEFDNRSHRSSTYLSLSEAFQPLPP